MNDNSLRRSCAELYERLEKGIAGKVMAAACACKDKRAQCDRSEIDFAVKNIGRQNCYDARGTGVSRVVVRQISIMERFQNSGLTP